MTVAKRNRELANDLARRAEEAHEEPQPDERPVNPFHDPAFLARQEAKQRRDAELLFGPQEPEPEPSDRPHGSADGGEGTGPDVEIEHVQTESGMEPMRVFDLNNLDSDKEDQ